MASSISIVDANDSILLGYAIGFAIAGAGGFGQVPTATRRACWATVAGLAVVWFLLGPSWGILIGSLIACGVLVAHSRKVYALIVLFVAFQFAIFPEFGQISAKGLVMRDEMTLQQMHTAIQAYANDNRGEWPGRLSELYHLGYLQSLRDFQSAREIRFVDAYAAGYRKRRRSREGQRTVPALRRVEDIDDGDFLYAGPESSTAADIAIWTRPGLLSGERAVVLRYDGVVEVIKTAELKR